MNNNSNIQTNNNASTAATSMDPRQLLLRAAYLNDRGFALMESGKQHEAFETFVVALESMSAMEHAVAERKQQRTAAHRAFAALPSHRRQRRRGSGNRQNKNNSQNSNSNQGSKKVDPPCSVLLDDDDHQHRSTAVLDGAAEDDDDGQDPYRMFMYNKAFRFLPEYRLDYNTTNNLPISPSDLDNDTHDEGAATARHFIHLYRAIVTFNSALSFHQRSMGAVHPSLKETAQSVASGLYLDAMTLLQTMCYPTLDTSRVLAATLNNAAMLSYDMQQYANFEAMQAMLHKLLVEIQQRFPTAMEQPQHQPSLQCFYFNATLLKTPSTAWAA